MVFERSLIHFSSQLVPTVERPEGEAEHCGTKASAPDRVPWLGEGLPLHYWNAVFPQRPKVKVQESICKQQKFCYLSLHDGFILLEEKKIMRNIYMENAS